MLQGMGAKSSPKMIKARTLARPRLLLTKPRNSNNSRPSSRPKRLRLKERGKNESCRGKVERRRLKNWKRRRPCTVVKTLLTEKKLKKQCKPTRTINLNSLVAT
jgi:hypothetical protein